MSMNQEFFSPAVWTALAIALGAGMATVLGGVLVVFFKANNTRLLSFGLAFSGGAMVYVSLVEIFARRRYRSPPLWSHRPPTPQPRFSSLSALGCFSPSTDLFPIRTMA